MTATNNKENAPETAAAESEAAEKTGALKLDKELNIQGVADLKDKLSASFCPGEAVCIDAGSVESIDTAALQLLVAFARHTKTQSSAVKWLATSDAFLESARLLDLEQHLGVGPASA